MRERDWDEKIKVEMERILILTIIKRVLKREIW